MPRWGSRDWQSLAQCQDGQGQEGQQLLPTELRMLLLGTDHPQHQNRDTRACNSLEARNLPKTWF